MKNIRLIFISFVSSILVVSLLSTCKKKDDPIIQSNNWQTIYHDSTIKMEHLQFFDNKIGFVLAGLVGVTDSLRGRQFILKTSDAGNSWTKYACQFPTVNDGASLIVPINGNTLIAVSNNVFKSTDNGYNWINLNPTYIGSGFFNIHILDSLNWVLAEGNRITLTSDGGKTWYVVFTTEFPAPFSHFYFPSNIVGYACGGADDDYTSFGFIAKTLDGGKSWAILNPEPWHSNNESFPDAQTIQFISDNIGYIFTVNGEIFKTIDGGSNWKLITQKQFLFLGYFLNENNGYCVDENNIYETIDGGKTWTTGYAYSKPSSDVNIMDMCFIGTGDGYAITRDSKIIKLLK
jgi:photosystem II stability/assembly factor-like uncharacterized protein